MSPYQPPSVEVLSDERTKEERRIVLRLLESERTWPPPLAPASLVRMGGHEVLLELHRVAESTAETATFSTSDDRDVPRGSPLKLGLQSWWAAEDLELMTDPA